MEQQIRFCTSADGTRIAYAIVGQGSPLVRILPWFTHLEFEWENPLWRSLIDRLSARHLLIRHDGRGMGLSDRQVSDYSPEAQVRDLEAVVDALSLERFALWGYSQGGATSITYAVRHPERVSRLILQGSFARMGWLIDSEEGQQLFHTGLSLIRQGWSTDLPAFRQFFTSLFMPDADAETIRQFNEMQRISTSTENAAALFSAMRDTDVSQLLSQVRAPALVVHCRGDATVPFEAGRELAVGIPGARFLPLDSRNHAILPHDPAAEVLLGAIDEFLSEGEEAAIAPAEPAAPGSFRTVLFTDVEGSTALTQRLGDAKAQEVLRTHNSIVRDALKAHSGSEIKHTGDGIMASFTSASRALECAIDIQRALAQHSESNPDTPIRVRIGLNAGEPVAEEQDLFGTAVQLAARICAQAEGEEILVSDTLRGLVAGKGFLFADRGETALRGFEDPVRLYQVRWESREKGGCGGS
jgi:class 3 adenylate cyclase